MSNHWVAALEKTSSSYIWDAQDHRRTWVGGNEARVLQDISPRSRRAAKRATKRLVRRQLKAELREEVETCEA